jgi:hypothetical protein
MSLLEELEDPARAHLADLMGEVDPDTAILVKDRVAEQVTSDWVPN